MTFSVFARSKLAITFGEQSPPSEQKLSTKACYGAPKAPHHYWYLRQWKPNLNAELALIVIVDFAGG